MTERTEEEKMMQVVIDMPLGGKIRQIYPMRGLKKSRVWRGKFLALIMGTGEVERTDSDDPEKLKGALDKLVMTNPDLVIDLVFDYLPDLPRQEIEDNATDQEVADVFDRIVQMAFPLVLSLNKASMRMSL